MDSSSTLILGMLFSAIGLGYFVYGKKQQKGVALFCGVALCAFPFLISNVPLMILIALVLMVLPYFLPY